MEDFEDINNDTTTVNELTDKDIKTFIENQLELDDYNDIDPSIIAGALRGMKMPMHISKPKGCVMPY